MTLDGDVYEPAGTLTGGAKSNQCIVLASLHELHTIQDNLNAVNKRLNEGESSVTRHVYSTFRIFFLFNFEF